MSFNVAIVSVKENEYRIHFWYMDKDEAINKQEVSEEKAKEYYENNKERLKGQAQNKCRELSNKKIIKISKKSI